MDQHDEIARCPALSCSVVNHRFAQHIGSVCPPARYSVSVIRFTVTVSHCHGITVPQCLCSSNSYFTSLAPKHKSSDAGNSDMPRRSCKVRPLIEKVFMHRKNCSAHRVVPVVSGVHWRTWNLPPADKSGLL